jgi:hypothetical protein
MLLQILNKFWEYTRTPSISCQQPSPCTLFFRHSIPPRLPSTAGQLDSGSGQYLSHLLEW